MPGKKSASKKAKVEEEEEEEMMPEAEGPQSTPASEGNTKKGRKSEKGRRSHGAEEEERTPNGKSDKRMMNGASSEADSEQEDAGVDDGQKSKKKRRRSKKSSESAEPKAAVVPPPAKKQREKRGEHADSTEKRERKRITAPEPEEGREVKVHVSRFVEYQPQSITAMVSSSILSPCPLSTSLMLCLRSCMRNSQRLPASSFLQLRAPTFLALTPLFCAGLRSAGTEAGSRTRERRHPGLFLPLVLRVSYAMSGPDIVCASSGARWLPDGIPSPLSQGAVCLSARYAMTVTDIAYGATRLCPPQDPRYATLSAKATRCHGPEEEEEEEEEEDSEDEDEEGEPKGPGKREKGKKGKKGKKGSASTQGELRLLSGSLDGTITEWSLESLVSTHLLLTCYAMSGRHIA
eukprot:3941836-Rhodomonas_salina.3